MSKRTTTRVTYEYRYDGVIQNLIEPPTADTLKTWIVHLYGRDGREVEVTEISRETVKGPKTERQEAFERRFAHYKELLIVGYSYREEPVYEFCAEALKAEIDKMEDER